MEKEERPGNGSLQETVARFPENPGVYLMKDEKDRILYVGKATNLRHRVRSYFSGEKDMKTAVLVRKIRNIEYIVTENEYEALLLENTLIKKHKPRYNINLKDGKSYPVIRITNEEYPRVFRTRRIVDDGSRYFGPFPAVSTLDRYLELIEKIFPLRKCRGPLKKNGRPCLYYHIGRCSGVCGGRISRDDYLKNVEGVRALLSGETGEIRDMLERQMRRAAEDLDFEKAASLRDALRAVEDLDRGQKVVDFDGESRDYIDWAEKERLCTFIVFQMRGGRLSGRELFRTGVYDHRADLPGQFLLQYYRQAEQLPGTIYLRSLPPQWQVPDYFQRELGRTVRLEAASAKRDLAVLNLARENAEHDLRKRLHERGNIPDLEDLAAVLGLPAVPLRIEGFDIAQLSGKHPVASLAAFLNGAPDRKSYRKFHIRSLAGEIDDYEAIREAVARRYTRILNEGLEPPDLVLIDGGKGQVGAARGVLDALGFQRVPVLGLSKRNEEIFLPGKKDPVLLPEGSPALRILQAVRDEAHRFATGFNRKLREKTLSLETLTSVRGIGEARGRKILRRYGSREAIVEATGYDIARTAGISLEVAESLLERLRKGD